MARAWIFGADGKALMATRHGRRRNRLQPLQIV